VDHNVVLASPTILVTFGATIENFHSDSWPPLLTLRLLNWSSVRFCSDWSANCSPKKYNYNITVSLSVHSEKKYKIYMAGKILKILYNIKFNFKFTIYC